MTLHNMLEVKIFDVWGIDFMGPFPPSNDAMMQTQWLFLIRNILTHFRTPRGVINDEGTHFCNKVFAALMAKYGVHHKKALAYHP